MSLAVTLQEDRRGLILSMLDEAGGNRLAEASVKSILDTFGHRLSGDQVRSELNWLEAQTLLRIERIPSGAGQVWMVQLLESGQDVARGVRHPGVRRQAPRG